MLTSVFSKIYESYIKRRLGNYFDQHKIIPNCQFGFKTKCRTTSAAVSLLDMVLRNIEANFITSCLFIDLKKAFDCLDFGILRNILCSHGIVDKALDLLVSFLTNRKQYVVIDSQRSSLLNVKSGVPQGSVLGPLFFLVYINDVFILI
jgi:hypothetical protein